MRALEHFGLPAWFVEPGHRYKYDLTMSYDRTERSSMITDADSGLVVGNE
jgi:hypothetical protein